MIIRSRAHPVHRKEWGGRLAPEFVRRVEADLLAQLAEVPRIGAGTTTVLWETREAGPIENVSAGARHGWRPELSPIPPCTIEWTATAFWTPVA